MSWSITFYLQFTGKAQADVVLGSPLLRDVASVPVVEWITRPVIGVDVDGNKIIVSPGTQRTGYWEMARLRPEAPGFTVLNTALAPFKKPVVAPCNVFA